MCMCICICIPRLCNVITCTISNSWIRCDPIIPIYVKLPKHGGQKTLRPIENESQELEI